MTTNEWDTKSCERVESGANKKMTKKRNRQSEKILKKTSCKENNKRQETKPKNQ